MAQYMNEWHECGTTFTINGFTKITSYLKLSKS